jgi:hypothetical protein
LSSVEPALSRSEAEALLYKLCVKLGFCLHPPHYDDLCDRPPNDATSFANAVVVAEGMKLTTIDRALYRQIRDCVTEAFRCAQIRKELEQVGKLTQ